MNGDPFEPVEVGPDAPALPDVQEWVIPKDRPDYRVAVFKVPEHAPADVREGLARVRVQVVEGVCPCGGVLVWQEEPPAPGTLGEPTGLHALDCPAHPFELARAARAWREQQDRDAGGGQLVGS